MTTTPNRYVIRLTAEFDDGAVYHVQREVPRAELNDTPMLTESALGRQFDFLQDMLAAGVARKTP